jgi:hypothetical protein
MAEVNTVFAVSSPPQNLSVENAPVGVRGVVGATWEKEMAVCWFKPDLVANGIGITEKLKV